MPDTTIMEAEILGLTRRLLEAVYRKDTDFYQAHSTTDMTAYEWFIAPERIPGVDFHLHLMSAGGMVGVDENARVDLLNPQVRLLGANGDAALVTFTLLVTYPAEGSAKPSFYSDHQTRVFERSGGETWKMVHFHRSPTHG